MTANTLIILAGALLGTAGLGGIISTFLNRKVGMKGNENEAKRDISASWDSIVTSVLAQLESVKTDLKETQGKVDVLEKEGQSKDRLLIVMFTHILRLEAIIENARPPIVKPDRPSEMKEW